MLIGGHSKPNSATGDIEEWKYDQKKATKNITSENINKAIEIIKLFCTYEECLPSKEASLMISLNQKNMVIKARTNMILDSKRPSTKPCMKLTPPSGTTTNKQDKITGQGLGVTICQKCCVFKKKVFIVFYKL